MNKIKKLIKYLLRDELTTQHRLINAILVVGIGALVFCTFFDFFVGTGIRTFWIMGLLILCFVFSLYIANVKNKPNAAGLILAVISNYFLMPFLYFLEGGKESGMPMWLTLAGLFVWLIVDGWPVFLIYIGDIILYASLLIIEYFHPEYVHKMADRKAEYIDYIFAISALIIIFGSIFKVQNRVYEKRRIELEDKERELTEMNLSLEKANEAKSIFLARMSHEIRTPINAVIGMNEMILRESAEANILNYAGSIETASNSLLSLINDILDFSKIESGLMKIIPEEYEVASLINDCYSLLDMRAKGKGLRLKLEHNEKLPSVLLGDGVRIKQIITNLLTNAVKYTDRGTITLEVDYIKKEDTRIDLVIRVTDTGRGISDEDIGGIFDSFSRADERQNRNIEGTGLGLSITKQLIDLMNGSISVKSKQGVGSEFTAVIPQTVVSREPIGNIWEKFNAGSRTGQNYRESLTAPEASILVVDDVQVNLQIIKLLLKTTQINIDTAESGRKAIELYEDNHYDLVFLDHMMPEMDGIETFDEIKKSERYKNEQTPIVVLTANAIQGADKEYMAVGFADYLTKPVQAKELEHVLIKLLPKDLVTMTE
ncbi:MAG: response regulator [Lachnospiraceae bacterium]|nr:response regulator [Lachnospiraceae bacterium]